VGEFHDAFDALAAARARLDALPESAAVERAELTERLELLRARMREMVVPVRTRAQIGDELRRLEARLDQMLRERINLVSQAGGSPAGDMGNVRHAFEINRRIDEATGRAGLEDRIRALRTELEESS